MDSKLKTVLIAVAALVVLGVLGFLIFSGGDEENAGNGASQQEVAERFVDWKDAWDQEAFEVASDKQRWIYFHLDGCPECSALDKEINANLSDIPEDVVIYKVDYDDNQDLRQQYGVTRQTTIVAVDAEGEKTGEILATGDNRDLGNIVEALYVEPEPSSEDGEMDGDDGSSNDSGSEGETNGGEQTDPGNGEDGSDSGTSASPGEYADWSQAAFEADSDKQRWLYFHAEWCPACRALHADINDNLGDIPENVIIYKIEYDDNQGLRQQYGVTTQTTVVSVDSAGDKIELYNAYSTPDLASVIEALE